MNDKYREYNTSDMGIQFYKNNKSILLQAISHGRIQKNDEIFSYNNGIDSFIASINGYNPLNSSIGRIIYKSDLIEKNDEPIFKYVSEATWDFIKEGSIQIGTCDFYRKSQIANIRDPREGNSTFFIRGSNKQLNVSIRVGSNCALFCGTRELFEEEDSYMRERHGKLKIKISPLNEFIDYIMKSTGASKSHTYDVIYSDASSIFVNDMHVDEIIAKIGIGDLNSRKLHRLNRDYFDNFYDMGFLSSLFIKPTPYSEENERRIVFEFDKDLKSELLRVNNKDILKYISIV